jgi:hypothetical protein
VLGAKTALAITKSRKLDDRVFGDAVARLLKDYYYPRSVFFAMRVHKITPASLILFKEAIK